MYLRNTINTHTDRQTQVRTRKKLGLAWIILWQSSSPGCEVSASSFLIVSGSFSKSAFRTLNFFTATRSFTSVSERYTVENRPLEGSNKKKLSHKLSLVHSRLNCLRYLFKKTKRVRSFKISIVHYAHLLTCDCVAA